ncbi:hypothetical protein DM860_013466 [Cuscuta australis]|uniref:Uncharacterized protein n=1 Tax=Cuscuta australis TaxID=267555 RepID=A0A328CZ99_9ASTE|nr:hypothetical protein DM860_013466 [Cuscuta australis]
MGSRPINFSNIAVQNADKVSVPQNCMKVQFSSSTEWHQGVLEFGLNSMDLTGLPSTFSEITVLPTNQGFCHVEGNGFIDAALFSAPTAEREEHIPL